MKKSQPSRTAEYMALFRAVESARPEWERLFDDPLAIAFLRKSFRLLVHLARVPFAGNIVPWLIDTKGVAGARSVAVVRTRFIDEQLVDALNKGCKQFVILGAGYDTRAYRIAGIEQARVFEIDHPNTSRAKQAHLKKRFRSLPQHVRFIAVDFNEQSLMQALASTDFDGRLKTFFIWEGVTNYLTPAAVDASFRIIRELAQEIAIVFTYVDRAVLDSDNRFEGAAELRRILDQAGERWTFGFEPAELKAYLAERSYRLLEDIGSTELRSRYLKADRRVLRGYEFYRLAVAESYHQDP
jgi:methyltransferase (TIGR00027 family)